MTTEFQSEMIVRALGKIAALIGKNDGTVNLLKNEKEVVDILGDINEIFEKIKNLIEKSKLKV